MSVEYDRSKFLRSSGAPCRVLLDRNGIRTGLNHAPGSGECKVGRVEAANSRTHEKSGPGGAIEPLFIIFY